MTKVAVMAVDPGGTTGVAWGVYDTALDSVGDMLAEGRMTGSRQVEGTDEEQAAQLVELWIDFEMMSRIRGEAERSVLVFEDFILRVGKGSSDRSGLSPVRITSLVYGVLMQREVGTAMPLGVEQWNEMRSVSMFTWKLQQPSSAKSFATKARLQRWGLWVKGQQHARDAWRHVALCIAEYDKWAKVNDTRTIGRGLTVARW